MVLISHLVLLCAGFQFPEYSKWHLVETSHIKKDYWTISSKLPVFETAWPLGQFAQSEIRRLEIPNFKEFYAQAQEEVPAIKEGRSDAIYEYQSNFDVKYNSRSLLSLCQFKYTYTAGAHGYGATTTMNFGMINGKPKKLGLNDLLLLEPDAKRNLNYMLLQKAMEQPGTDWIDEGMIIEFEESQIQNFWVSESGLKWEFNPYELGSYASGPFTLSLSWAELRTMIRPHGLLSKYIQN